MIIASIIGSGSAPAGRSKARDASTPERNAARAGDLARASVNRSATGGAGGAPGVAGAPWASTAACSIAARIIKMKRRIGLLHGQGCVGSA